jgi:hypothetical protein
MGEKITMGVPIDTNRVGPIFRQVLDANPGIERWMQRQNTQPGQFNDPGEPGDYGTRTLPNPFTNYNRERILLDPSGEAASWFFSEHNLQPINANFVGGPANDVLHGIYFGAQANINGTLRNTDYTLILRSPDTADRFYEVHRIEGQTLEVIEAVDRWRPQ